MYNKAMRPLPSEQGFGFCTQEPVSSEIAEGYKLETIGRYQNYHFTAENHSWPVKYDTPAAKKFDAFSPNLNKHLHVGHLRNLALANALSRIFSESEFVAMLGCSLGVAPGALDALNDWLSFTGYSPTRYSDTELVSKAGFNCFDGKFQDGTGEFAGTRVWAGKNGPVVVLRSNKTPTYAFHDLAFAHLVGPDYYVTGLEQKEHFENLGLGGHHLPMGLVLDPETGKKIKSRDGNALSGSDAIKMVVDKLNDTPEPKKLAWNVLAWNMLHAARSKNLKFEVDKWIKPESPGLYITYTVARVYRAFAASVDQPVGSGKDRIVQLPAAGDFKDQDVALLGYASYFEYWKNRAVELLDPVAIANYAHELARQLGGAYHDEKIADGRPSFRYAVLKAVEALESCMKLLGMFVLKEV